MLEGKRAESKGQPESATARSLENLDRGRLRFHTPMQRLVTGFGLLAIIAGLSLCATQDLLN